MSYILDALRRADAERERGAVPSLQSQQQTIIEDDAATVRQRPLVWAVVALGVALLALLAWSFFGGTQAPTRAPIELGRWRRLSRHSPAVALPRSPVIADRIRHRFARAYRRARGRFVAVAPGGDAWRRRVAVQAGRGRRDVVAPRLPAGARGRWRHRRRRVSMFKAS